MNTTSSGDDHLLTADSQDLHFKHLNNYHDNRAFQHHNNNILHSGKCDNDGDDLNVVIIQQHQQQQQRQHSKKGNKELTTEQILFPRSISGVGANASMHSTCHHHQQRISAAKFLSRQRHNATQTPESALQSGDWSERFHGLHHCASTSLCCHCCNHGNNNFCRLATAINTTKTHTATCFQQQQQRRNSRDNCMGDIKASSGDMTCHCHITHHCHQHFSPSVGADGSHNHVVQRRRHHKRRREHCTKRRHQKHQQQRHLPLSTTKSSLSSDEQLDERPHRSNWQHGTQTQEIAIEIDAATTTLTDDNISGCNSSTGTSNFSYKLAKDTNSQLPIILAPLHDKPRCRHSLNSNTTLETSELTADDSSNDGADFGRSIKLQCQEAGESPISPSPVICCEDPQCCRVVAAAKLHNECVKIKRKRFISQQYCSSCSKCSSCSCQIRTSSCSSIDDFEADLQEFDATGTRKAHELTVSADCHRCQLQRQSTNSTVESGNEENGHAEHGIGDNAKVTKRQLGTDSDSARTSRRSSRESFCSCNSTSCCYCSCSCEEYDASYGRHYAMQTEGDADQHSSTLTPITQPSTPMGDDAPTLRSNSAGLEDESPSLSQSAEYFSLSSNQQSLQQQIATVASPELIPPRKQCKHYSKHHRHKPDSSPMKNYL